MLGKIALLLCLVLTALAIPRPNVPEGSENDVSICSLPPVSQGTKKCRGFFPRWTYDAKTKSCTGFLYGGCGGTENLFQTEFACLARCNKQGLEKLIKRSNPKSRCMQPKAEGLCRAVIPSFFFDVQTGKCTLFDFSGCHGNDNRFATEEECEQACYHYPTYWQDTRNPPSTFNPTGVTTLGSDHGDVHQETLDVCSLRTVNPGPKRCKINTQGRWTYNSKTGRCDHFDYIPCSSVDPPNLFLNEFACLARCNEQGLKKLIDYSDPSSPCMQTKAAGNCRLFIPRFFFDKQTGTCASFIYTGCGGNDNNFKSQEECYLKCNNNGSLEESDSVTVNYAAGTANVEVVEA